MNTTRILQSSSIISICLAMSIGINAQDAYAQAREGNVAAGVPDIIVTALKRSESIQDVPATITAFSQQDVETRQINGLTDLISLVPSLQVGYTFGSNSLALRGISTNLTSGFEDPSVAVHINGVYQARSHALNLALMDLERVEVLSGPQGTLYGRNATGGVINYILRRPTDQMEAEITAKIGNYESYGLKGHISGPINDTVSFRISGLWDNRDKGFIKNVLPGASKSSFHEEKIVGIRGVLAFQPTETLEIDLEGSFASTRSSFQPTALGPSLNATRQAQMGNQTFEPRKVAAKFPGRNDSKDYSASATIRWDMSDDVKLTSITAYKKYKNNMDLDLESSPGDLQDVFNQYHSDTYTQELNLNTVMFDGRLNSVFGIFYFHDNVFGATQLFGDTLALFGFGTTYTKFFDADNFLRSRSISFFTDQTLNVTDKLRLLGGVRYNEDKKKTTNRRIANCLAEIVNDQKFTAWTPKAGLQYDVTDNIMAYGNYQKGFKAGGVAMGTCGNAFEPETIKGFEIGLKTQLFDNRVRFNIAGYWYKYGNIQVQKTLGTVGGFTVQNAAQSKIKGIEASLDAEIVDRLQLSVSGMVQSAKYTDFVNCNNRAFLGACSSLDPRPVTDPSRNEQLSGNWLNRAAPYSLNVGLQYTADVGGGELVLRGESYWSGKVRYSEFDAPLLTQSAYSLQNAYLTYTPESEKFTFRLFAKNIANKDHFATAYFNGFTAQDQAVWAEPRTFGAEASYRF